MHVFCDTAINQTNLQTNGRRSRKALSPKTTWGLAWKRNWEAAFERAICLTSLILASFDPLWQDSGLTDCLAASMTVVHALLRTSVTVIPPVRTLRRLEMTACSAVWQRSFRSPTSSSWRRSDPRFVSRKESTVRSWMICWLLAVVLYVCWCSLHKKSKSDPVRWRSLARRTSSTGQAQHSTEV